MAADTSPFGEPVIHFSNAMDRRKFLRVASAVGVGSALVVSGVACSDNDKDERKNKKPAKASAQDLAILNYALTLEYLESEFYAKGLSSNLLSGRELDLIRPISAHEADHVQTLKDTLKKLNGKPVSKPDFTFPPETFTDRAKFLQTASTFEELGVDAYHGQVTRLQDPTLLAAAASIAGVESRHAAILADITGGRPFPAPVEDSKDMKAVLAAVQPFLKASPSPSGKEN